MRLGRAGIARSDMISPIGNSRVRARASGEGRGSPAGAAGGTSSTAPRLVVRPAFNIGLEPDLDAPVAEVEDWSGHVWIPVLVDAHGVAMGQAKELCHGIGVDQVIDVDSLAHPR